MPETQRAGAARPELIRTPDQRLRVFVSSTLEELAPERAAAREAIEGLRLAPVMFELGARPYAPRDLYRAYLEQSHVFVGIYWRQYGWVAPNESISGLEDELVLSATRPRLIYIKKPAADRDPRLASLLAGIKAEAAASYRSFATPEELRRLIQDDLALLLSERFERLQAAASERPRRALSNLPVPRTALVGREAELRATCDLVRAGASLVTLTGPGGCGKSRLAIEAALELLGEFRDGAFIVELESIRESALVVPAIADALDVRLDPGRPGLVSLGDQLRSAHMLLLLDNFEQVAEAGRDLASLLERCPGVVALVTSRAPVRLRAEQRLAVPPLPAPTTFHSDVARLSRYAAVALFVQRACTARPGFVMTAENAPAVAEICHRLDGLPLAIELAAARLRLLGPVELLSRIGRRLDMLGGGAQDLPSRQHTLRRAIDWSYDLLAVDARTAFRRLAVFGGGAPLDGAEAVAGSVGPGDPETLDLIGALVDQSMLTSTIGPLGEMRVGMLDTIREYATEKLDESGERDEVQRRHAAWYLALAERAEPHLVATDEPAWAERLQQERANARVALEWAADHDLEMALRIATATGRFWEAHGAIVEGHAWFERLVGLPGEPSALRAHALAAASRFAASVGKYGVARRHVSAAVRMARRAGDRAGVALALHEYGSLALYEGRIPEARRRLTASLAASRALGDHRGTARSLLNLGLVALCEGDRVSAEAQLRESLGIFQGIDERFGAAAALGNLSEVARLDGRLGDAFATTLDSLRVYRELGDQDGIAASFDGLAKLANADGAYGRAARLFGFASALREGAGTTPALLEREELEREIADTQRGAGAFAFESEWHAGRALSIEEALAVAVGSERRAAPGTAPRSPHGIRRGRSRRRLGPTRSSSKNGREPQTAQQ